MDPKAGRIESWKSIAEYLHCTERTARRWETSRNLPVYRYQGDGKSGVYAFTEDLDKWLEMGRTSGDDRDVEIAERSLDPDANEPPAPVLDPQASDVVTTPSVEGASSGQTAPPIVPPVLSSATFMRRRIAIAAVLVIGSLSLLGVVIKGSQRHDAPVSLRVEGATLEALDAAGRPLWTRVFSAPFPPTNPPQELSDRSWIGDLEGDGFAEVLFFAAQPAGGGASEDTLYCFDSAGKELWSFRLQDTIKFRTGNFGPPWYRGLLTVYEVRGEKRIAVAMAHQTWWPAPLLTLNAHGQRLSTFVSSGLIYQLRATTREGRPLLLAGGVSNSLAAASLIVLEGENPAGTTLEVPGSPYECLSCSQGQPLKYFSFPKADLTGAAKTPYNWTAGVRASNSEVVLQVPVGNVPGMTAAHFRFNSAFQLTDARWGDNFALIHQSYEEAGTLHHSAATCPNRVPQARVYEPGRGLVELSLTIARTATR